MTHFQDYHQLPATIAELNDFAEHLAGLLHYLEIDSASECERRAAALRTLLQSCQIDRPKD